MQKNSTIALVFLLLGAIAGCNSMSEGEFKTGQAVLSGSPAVRKQAIRDCIEDTRNDPLATQKTLATVLNVSLSRMPAVACSRLFNAYASGRITYQDYKNWNTPNGDISKVIRILQGR